MAAWARGTTRRARREGRGGRHRPAPGHRGARAATAWGVALAALLGGTGAAAAQERIEEADLPRAVADQVVELFNDPATVQLSAPATVAPGSAIVGDVAVLGGPVTVAGEVRGGLVVVNGDVLFRGVGRVTGDLLVIGGTVTGDAPGSVGGAVVVYREALPYRRRGDHIEIEPPRERRHPLRTDFGPGDAHITIRAGTSYNRVEGLPVMFGPVIESRDEHPLRVEALGVWRSESGLTVDDLGYRLRVEQALGWTPDLALGVTVHSEVRPIEEWGISDLETSLATFFLHRDYRDHLERTGWSIYARARIPSVDLEMTAEYVDENHAFASVGSPWTLTRNDEAWRAQPLVGVGDLRTVVGTVVHDDRNDPEHPTDGWYALARLTRGVDGDLALPFFEADTGPVSDEPLPVSSSFTTGFLDVRRHLRVSPDADLALRLVAGGALGDRSPPPQQQIALGGEGSLPGYGLFTLDCGARSRAFSIPRADAGEDESPVEPVFAAYGCDRALLAQLQYRAHTRLPFGMGNGDASWEDWDWYPAVDLSPTWVAFADVGHGWVVDGPGAAIPGLARTDGRTLADVGAGLFLGDLGLMVAYPLQGDHRRLNFFVRLSRRF